MITPGRWWAPTSPTSGSGGLVGRIPVSGPEPESAMIWLAWKRISGHAVWLAIAALAAGAPARGAESGATVTAVTGNAGAGGSPLERQSSLADGDSLQTGDDGACSLLVDRDAVLEVCQGTSLRLGHRDGKSDGPRVLELRRGEIRVLAEPRAAAQRIEIHTPAAIATILGSVVYVAVDANGVTTIAAAESKVRVESPRRPGSGVTLRSEKSTEGEARE